MPKKKNEKHGSWTTQVKKKKSVNMKGVVHKKERKKENDLIL